MPDGFGSFNFERPHNCARTATSVCVVPGSERRPSGLSFLFLRELDTRATSTMWSSAFGVTFNKVTFIF